MEIKKILPIMMCALPTGMMAQGATDVFKMSQSELRGTARYMGMAGAFGALGGDLTVLGQNPGGIGVYRSSDFGVTVDFDAQSTKTECFNSNVTANQLKVDCNNVGYVGAMRLDSDIMPNINWGVTYSRPVSFNRHYSGHFGQLKSSLSNFVAETTNSEKWTPSDLDNSNPSTHDPYIDTYAPWMSILGYNSFLINNVGSSSTFHGLYDSMSKASGEYEVTESGGVNEFNLNFGGNIANVVYWGLGFGITDINYRSRTYYGETIENAQIAEFVNQSATGRLTRGQADYGIVNDLHTFGSGWNFKMGVIVKPINEFRLGIAFHTPTYYSLKDETITYASSGFSPNAGLAGNSYTVDDYTNQGYLGESWYKIRTPWRYIASAAAVVGGKGILSFDYEYQAYDGIEYRTDTGVLDPSTQANVKSYYKGLNIFRVGAEYRVTPQFSVRAGYSYQDSPVKDNAFNNNEVIYQGSTTPAYTFDKSTQYITCGLGYRYKWFYADLAYAHKTRKGEYHAFTPYENSENEYVESPTAKLTDTSNRVVLTMGVRF